MLQPPKRTKYRKMQKGMGSLHRGFAKGSTLVYGKYGLQLQGRGRLNARQIEAARRAIVRTVKRGGRLWIRVFPDHPVTAKPLEVRQGKGKGNVEYYAYMVKPGAMLFEISGVSEEMARTAFHLAAGKLPFKVRFVQRIDKEEEGDDE
jgi:large subunit ribosomal protein L16